MIRTGSGDRRSRARRKVQLNGELRSRPGHAAYKLVSTFDLPVRLLARRVSASVPDPLFAPKNVRAAKQACLPPLLHGRALFQGRHDRLYGAQSLTERGRNDLARRNCGGPGISAEGLAGWPQNEVAQDDTE